MEAGERMARGKEEGRQILPREPLDLFMLLST